MPGRVLLVRAALGMMAGIAVGTLISEATYVFLRNGEERTSQVIELDIPPGTAERIESGEPEPSIPASMTFVVGDVLVVRNRDSVNHELGPLFIPAGSSASLRTRICRRTMWRTAPSNRQDLSGSMSSLP